MTANDLRETWLLANQLRARLEAHRKESKGPEVSFIRASLDKVEAIQLNLEEVISHGLTKEFLAGVKR